MSVCPVTSAWRWIHLCLASAACRDVDNVAEVMDGINESIGLADELSDAMAQPIGPIMDEVIAAGYLGSVLSSPLYLLVAG